MHSLREAPGKAEVSVHPTNTYFSRTLCSSLSNQSLTPKNSTGIIRLGYFLFVSFRSQGLSSEISSISPGSSLGTSLSYGSGHPLFFCPGSGFQAEHNTNLTPWAHNVLNKIRFQSHLPNHPYPSLRRRGIKRAGVAFVVCI